MSWDVMVFDCGGKPKPPEELNEEDFLKDMGPPAEVRAKIDAALPGVDWSDPAWGVYGEEGFTLEFSLGARPQVQGFMVLVHGGGDPLPALFRFATPNGWSLLDCSTSEWLDPENPSTAGWQGFQNFRDQALGRKKKKTKKQA